MTVVRRLLALTALVLAAGCSGVQPTEPEPPVTTLPSATESPANSPNPTKSSVAGVPNVVGKGLAAAKDQLNQAGHTVLSHDATPRGRVQLDLNDWQVCFQTLEKDETSKEKQHVELGVVALNEKCPATDQSLTAPTLGPDQLLPDFTGRGLAEATRALGRDASVRPVDVSGQDRNVLWEKDWQICTQSLKPGTKWTGQPIRFDVVKWDERCPAT